MRTIRWMRCTVYCHYGPDLLKIAINFTDIDHSRVVYPSHGSNWSSRNCRLRPPVAAQVRNERRDWRQRRGGTHSRWFQSPDGFNRVTRTRMNQPRSSGYVLLSGVLWKRGTKHTGNFLKWEAFHLSLSFTELSFTIFIYFWCKWSLRIWSRREWTLCDTNKLISKMSNSASNENRQEANVLSDLFILYVCLVAILRLKILQIFKILHHKKVLTSFSLFLQNFKIINRWIKQSSLSVFTPFS